MFEALKSILKTLKIIIHRFILPNKCYFECFSNITQKIIHENINFVKFRNYEVEVPILEFPSLNRIL